MSFSWERVAAIVQKELRDYRRNRFVIGTMTVLPLLFIALPMIQLFFANAEADTANLNRRIGLSLLYMLVIPAFLPSTLSAYSVVGEREQGTLEPVLITPIRREEFLIGKALAAFVPTLVISYTVFGIFLAAAALFAHRCNRLGDLLRHARAGPVAVHPVACRLGDLGWNRGLRPRHGCPRGPAVERAG